MERSPHPFYHKSQKNYKVQFHPMTQWITVHGILVQGYQVASGPSADYPYGALERQRPIFKARGFDLGDCFNGTLNVDIRPRTFTMVKPEYTFEHVEWTDLHPPETFSFSRCKVIFKEIEYDGWVYYPHPETKLRNFQNPSLFEVIAPLIPEIKYGDALDVLVNPAAITVTEFQPEVSVNRKKMIVGAAILAVFLILSIAGIGFLFSRLKPQPQAKQRPLISELVYCNSHDIKPCIVSFSLDADGNMLVNMLTPSASYPNFYLTVSDGSVENRYECQQVEDFPTNVYCTGVEMLPGEALQFTLFALEDDSVLAEGSFAIIGLLLATPESEASATSLANETPTPGLLEFPTPTLRVPATRTPSYPNPTSYPYP